MGAIGYALNGVAIYNALDDAGRDAVAHEVQDSCDGHPQQAGQYHYHGPSECMPHADEHNALVGYALDGFGIYSPYDADGQEYTNADLDECHGTTSEIEWNGEMVSMYHYVLTQEYPYTIGCFRGTPVAAAIRGPQAGGPNNGP
jgi:YHYH protein